MCTGKFRKEIAKTEVCSEYDYRDGLNEIGSAKQQIVDMCEELRMLELRKNKAEERKAAHRL
jgi:hypothetical protein